MVHSRLFAHLKAHSKMCSEMTIPAAPRITGSRLTACCELDGFLPGGMTGHLVYKFRKDPSVSPCSGDDYLSIDFEAEDGFYKDVIDDFIPSLIQGMKACMLTMGDEKFDEPWPQADGSYQVGGPRACGCQLHPVFFLADWWLEQSYRVTLEEALKAVEPVAQRASIMEDGLFVVVSDVSNFEEARARVLQVETRLRMARPGLAKFFRSLFNFNS